MREGPDVHIAERDLFTLRRDFSDPATDTELHLFRRAFGEREGDDIVLGDAFDADPPRDAQRHYFGLARTGTCHDQ